MKRPSRKPSQSRMITLIKQTEPRELLKIMARIFNQPRKK